MAELLPATQELLLELLEGLSASDRDLPEVRVRAGGRYGARVWLYGAVQRSFEGRYPPAQFDELSAARLLRKLRSESSGVYYAFTPAAFQLRELLAASKAPPKKTRARPAGPPPELVDALSMRDQLQRRADDARESLSALTDASGITTYRNDPNSPLFYIPMHPHSWLDLDREHIPLLGSARERGEAWLATSRLVVAMSAPEHLEEFNASAATLRRIYMRGDKGAPGGTLEAVRDAIEAALANQLAILNALPGAVEGARLLVVPDTNALLQDPAIEHWVVGDEPASIVLAQQVIAELDAKKVNGNDRIAPKAESLIKRFKEYSRRGDTFAGVGVKLRVNLSFREVPITPNMALMPGSFDPDHADDRILATAIQLAARHLSSRVVLVTRDRNLQNKARFVGVPAVDVADL